MKTHSKFLRGITVLSTSALMFCSSSVLATTDSVELPTSSEESKIDLSVVPPSNLQIASIVLVEFNGGVNVRCFGQSNGSATAEVTGGLAPYTYTWSGLPNQTGSTAYGMSAGTYTLTVTDALGFSVSESVTLIQSPPLQAVITASPILCNGGVSTIVISSTGGTAPISGYNWYQQSAGSYNYTVADANGCRNKGYVTITEPPVFEASSFATPILCNGDLADVYVEGFGGTAPYSGVGPYSEGAGVSNYTIQDANGCWAYTSISINEPPALIADVSSTDILCRGGNSEVTVTGSGGVAPYMGTGFFSEIVGNYQYTVTDNNGCQSTASISITQPTALVATISNTPILCNGDFSTVSVMASGGISPYTGIGDFSTGAGLQSYLVSDANGCSVEISTMIIQPKAINVDISWAPIESPGGTTNVSVTASGGTAPFSGTGNYNLPTGTHVFTIVDANGCSTTQEIFIAPGSSSSLDQAGTTVNENGTVKTNGINSVNNSLVQAAFNLSSKEVEISYRLEYDSKVRIEVLDMTGAVVETFQEDLAIEGENYTVSIESGKFKSGVYIYQFVTDSERQIGKLQIIR